MIRVRVCVAAQVPVPVHAHLLNLSNINDQLAGVPLLVLANKQDLQVSVITPPPNSFKLIFLLWARHGGAEVAGLTVDRRILVRFPAYPHRVWALWWQGG